MKSKVYDSDKKVMRIIGYYKIKIDGGKLRNLSEISWAVIWLVKKRRYVIPFGIVLWSNILERKIDDKIVILQLLITEFKKKYIYIKYRR